MIKNSSNFIIIAVVALSASIIFSLATITNIETTYANHTKYHLNTSLVDVTISSEDDIPDALLEDLKRGIAGDLKAEEKKGFENNNNSQLQTTTIEDTTKAKIILTSQNFKKGDLPQIVGQVKNVGNGTAQGIKMSYSFYDQNNDILLSEYMYLDVSKLMPGQKASFSNTIIDELVIDEMTHYELGLTWDNSDGSQEYIEDVEVTKDPEEKTPIIKNNDDERINENLPFFNTEAKDIGELSDNEDDKDKDDDKDEDDDKNNKEDDENEDDNEEDEEGDN
jgi:hypothetical protein